MLKCFSRPGSQHYWVENKQPLLSLEVWEKTRHIAVKLLASHGHEDAAHILQNDGFSVYKGANDFNDDFAVLYRQVGFDEYLKFEFSTHIEHHRNSYEQIANILNELGQNIRFIGIEFVDDSTPQPVASPKPKLTSSAVEQALGDAQQLVSQKRPVSAVDRAHTALHGYLNQICADANLVFQNSDPGLTHSVNTLIKQHPKFANLGTQKEQIGKVFKAMSVICDALNPIRNHGSLAHANEELLEPAEAMLAINASRTLLHYIDQKLQ